MLYFLCCFAGYLFGFMTCAILSVAKASDKYYEDMEL